MHLRATARLRLHRRRGLGTAEGTVEGMTEGMAAVRAWGAGSTARRQGDGTARRQEQGMGLRADSLQSS